MAVLGFVATGIIAGVIQARKLAENNVYQSTAMSSAVGYLEQIMNIEYAELQEAIAGSGRLETKIDQGVADPIFLDQWTEKTVTIDTLEDGTVESTMTLWVRPEITDREPVDGIEALQINLRYRWLTPDRREISERTLKMVRSNIPTF